MNRGSGNPADDAEIIDYFFTEDEDRAWQAAEPDFTKRIATPLPTKRRRRVTWHFVLGLYVAGAYAANLGS